MACTARRLALIILATVAATVVGGSDERLGEQDTAAALAGDDECGSSAKCSLNALQLSGRKAKSASQQAAKEDAGLREPCMGGMYTDPEHYQNSTWKGTRMVSVHVGKDFARSLTVTGSDDGTSFWTLHGHITNEANHEFVMDFLPKGGRANLTGHFRDNQLFFEDGNVWQRVATPSNMMPKPQKKANGRKQGQSDGEDPLFGASATMAVHEWSDPLNSESFKERVTCVANRLVDQDRLQQALDWACGNMDYRRFDCSAVPEQCNRNQWSVADYVFSSYFTQTKGSRTGACDFNGAAVYVDMSDYVAGSDGQCVAMAKPNGAEEPAKPTDQNQQPHPTGAHTHSKAVPGEYDASVTHYSEFDERSRTQLASGCMPARFYSFITKPEHEQKLKQETPELEGWYEAAAPIWMTQPMHGRNTAMGQAGYGTKTTWFDYGHNMPHVPNGPGNGMMFDGGPPVDGYDTSDGCWEATWDGPDGQSHRVGLAVVDNCGHSDGIGNTVQNIKWCVPFEFTDFSKGGTCPLKYFDKCFPERQASKFPYRPNCGTDREVIQGMGVTNDAPWAKMVIGTYTETWCPDPNNHGSCAGYGTPQSARLNNTIKWSGQGSQEFQSRGKCVNMHENSDDLPELGSCSANVHDGDKRCRNAYGFPYHFDLATFKKDGKVVAPPWGNRNTRVRNVKRRACPKVVKAAYLNSCGVPDMYTGNNVVFGNAEASYVPEAWCKTSMEECLASALYRGGTRDYLASTGYAHCHSEKCQRMYQSFGSM